jgi:hypothetical protein
MKFKEILDGITRHRDDRIEDPEDPEEMKRKIDEIEWALHAIAEKLAEDE